MHDNLAHLGVDRLDVVNLRVMTAGEPIAHKFAVLAELQARGLIRHLGVSNVDSAQLAEAQRIAPVPGSSDPAHVADNVAAASLTLTEADLAGLSRS